MQRGFRGAGVGTGGCSMRDRTRRPRIFLYKLHGFARLVYRGGTGTVSYSDSPSKIADERVALIFGTSYKLQYVDPFLFLAYQLRRWDARGGEARRGDWVWVHGRPHQRNTRSGTAPKQHKAVVWRSLHRNRQKKCRRRSSSLRSSLMHKPGQVLVNACGARCFLDEQLSVDELAGPVSPRRKI